MLEAPGGLVERHAQRSAVGHVSDAIEADLTTPKVPFWTLTARPEELVSWPVKDDVPPMVRCPRRRRNRPRR